MDELVSVLRQEYPHLVFTPGTQCYWSPQNKTITYIVRHDEIDCGSLLHEVGHAVLEHTTYDSDIELLQKEMQAWEVAREMAARYSVIIDDERVQSCLDSYRDWISRRSTCPDCHIKTLQDSPESYTCFNCHATWRVTPARHHRSYRRKIKTA